eukprot:7866790-Pyramimonas_sp.AAC.1
MIEPGTARLDSDWLSKCGPSPGQEDANCTPAPTLARFILGPGSVYTPSWLGKELSRDRPSWHSYSPTTTCS